MPDPNRSEMIEARKKKKIQVVWRNEQPSAVLSSVKIFEVGLYFENQLAFDREGLER